MKKYPIDRSSKNRGFIEERIKILELLDNIEKRADKRRTRIDSTRLIREERENS